MAKFGLGTAVVLALLLVTFGVIVGSRGPTAASATARPQLVSMADAAAAMSRAGEAMKTHGQAMIAAGQRSGDADLTAAGEQWLRDENAILSGGDWMLQNPTAPGNLHAAPSELQAQGSWAELNRRVEAMVHDPSGAGAVDLEALRADGLAMLAEGQNMAAHGKLMSKEIDLMLAKNKMPAAAADDLRQAAATVEKVGSDLAANGQAMIDYADRLRRSMGYSN